MFLVCKFNVMCVVSTYLRRGPNVMHFHEFFAKETSPVDFFSLQFFYLGINWIMPFLLQAVAAVAFSAIIPFGTFNFY